MIRQIRLRCGGWVVAALMPGVGWNCLAEGATNDLSRVVVEGLPLDETVLPTARTVESVMGDYRTILETPRSVSVVTKAQMEARAISRATDFNQYSPGVYTPSRYGLANVPVIRGDLAEIYQNGQRTIYSRNALLASFNPVEAMDIVKGPGSAVFGPQGLAAGGYVNFVTKAPRFDGFQGELISRWGTYVPGGQSYFTPEWVLDVGGPVNEKLAYRVSYLGREADGYYRNTTDNRQDLYAALTWLPTERWTIDWNVQLQTARFNEVVGINRVTQELIDDWVYVAGPVVANPARPSWATPSQFALLDPAGAQRVKVYPWQTLNAPSDSAAGKRWSSQMTTTYVVSEQAKVVNRAYGETQESRKLSGYGYTEWIPENWMINDRLELHLDFDPSVGGREFPVRTISGVDVRYSELVSYQDFSVEPFFIHDVTQSPGGFVIPGLPAGTSAGGGYNVPGAPGYGGVPWASVGNQDSELLQAGLFSQWDVALHERFSVIVGARGDYYDASAASPAFVEVARGGLYESSADALKGSVFVSGILKWTPGLSSYVTYNRAAAVAGSANFGGVDGSGGDAGLERSLGAESELVEVGSKASLFGNRVYVGAALFRQSRVAPQLVGSPIGIETRGIELEAFYQPDRNFNASANLTLQDAKQDDASYQQTFSHLDGFPVGFVVDGQSGTGVGSPNYNAAAGRIRPAGRLRAASVPQVMFNAYLTYQFDNGFGASFGPQVTGEQWQDQVGNLRIPAQFTLNAFLFYRRPRWDVQVNFFNLTDERNWTSIDPGFAGNDLIFPEQPFRISGQVRYRF